MNHIENLYIYLHKQMMLAADHRSRIYQLDQKSYECNALVVLNRYREQFNTDIEMYVTT